MRALIVAALLLLSTVASAEKMERLDVCAVNLSRTATALAKANATIAELQQRLIEMEQLAKYRIESMKDVDAETLEIKRAPKPDPKAPSVPK